MKKKTGSGLEQSVKFEEKNVFVLDETPFRPCAIAHFCQTALLQSTR